MSEFVLHPQLAADTLPLASLALCDLRLMNDAQYPWLVLVPRQAHVTEVLDLDARARALLWQEVEYVASALRGCLKPDKLNIAALGNMVPQLHVHVIARFHTDAAWPKPVWGVVPPRPYADAELVTRLALLRTALAQTIPSS